MKFGKIITFIAIPIFALWLTACGAMPDSYETESVSSADFESAEGKQIRLITDNTEVTVTCCYDEIYSASPTSCFIARNYTAVHGEITAIFDINSTAVTVSPAALPEIEPPYILKVPPLSTQTAPPSVAA